MGQQEQKKVDVMIIKYEVSISKTTAFNSKKEHEMLAAKANTLLKTKWSDLVDQADYEPEIDSEGEAKFYYNSYFKSERFKITAKEKEHIEDGLGIKLQTHDVEAIGDPIDWWTLSLKLTGLTWGMIATAFALVELTQRITEIG